MLCDAKDSIGRREIVKPKDRKGICPVKRETILKRMRLAQMGWGWGVSKFIGAVKVGDRKP